MISVIIQSALLCLLFSAVCVHSKMSVDSLARCIMSEASIGNHIERVSVGFACQRNSAHAKNQGPTPAVRKLAEDILGGKVKDPTKGADHWYSPMSMPKDGQSTKGFDVGGGLEGPLKGMKKRNWRPKWATTCKFIGIKGVREAYFKFYKCSKK